jgi:hypothetical protein
VQALIGLVGVVVGALLSALLGYTQERRREHTQTRSGVRLLAADLEDAHAELKRMGLPSASGEGTKAVAQLKELWLGRRGPLADGLEKLEWDRISLRLRLIEAPSGGASPEQFQAQLETIKAALETVREVLGRVERRWRSRFRLAPLRAASASSAASLADLVLAHFLWQQDRDPETSRRYQVALTNFEAAHGWIIDVYWTRGFPGGVALTVQRNRGLQRLFRGRKSLEFHRATAAMPEAPALADLLHRYDALAARVSALGGTPRDIGMHWILAGSSFVLGFVERRPDFTEEEIDRVSASAQEELTRIERYYSRALARRAQILYVSGCAVGVAGVAAILVPLSLEFASPAVTAVVLAGALGATLASLLRMSTFDRGEADLGPRVIFWLGSARAAIGATVGTIVFAVAEAFFGPPNTFVLASVALIVTFVAQWAVSDWGRRRSRPR